MSKTSLCTETSILLAILRLEIILEKGVLSTIEINDISAFTKPCLQLPSTWNQYAFTCWHWITPFCSS